LIRNTYAQLVQKEPVEYEIYQLVSNGDESKFVIFKTSLVLDMFYFKQVLQQQN